MRDRDTVRPAFRIRYSRSANSRGLRSTSRPFCVTRRVRGSSVRLPTASIASLWRRPARRMSACTRAIPRLGLDHAVALLAGGLAQEAPQIAVVLDDENLHAAKYGEPRHAGNERNVIML